MKLRLISLILLCCILISGCGSDTDTIDTENSPENSVREEKAVQGGTMTLSMRSPETLNPIKNRDNTVDRVLRLIYEPLFIVDKNMQLQPNLAEKYEVKGNSITLTLKSGVKWEDGNPVTSDDVIYTLRQIENAGLDTIYKSCTDNLTSYNKVDNLTVRLSYSKGLGSVGYSLCFPVIPKHYYSGKAAEEMKPVGNGSYKFSSYTMVKELNLTASDTGLNGRPYITDISVKIMPDVDTEIQALEAGIIDAAVLDINGLGALSTGFSQNTEEFNTNQFEFAAFNIQNEMFSNVSVRQGLAHLIPTEDIVKNIYINRMTSSVTPINPVNPYTSKVGENTYEFDTNLANTLVSAGGKGFSSFNFSILVNSENSTRVESAELISKAFNSVGMNTRVEALPFSEYEKRLKEGNFEMYLGGIRLKENMDISALAMSSGNINYGKYADVDMDKLIGDCNSAISEEGYKAALSELNKYFSSQLPVVGIGFKSDMLVTNSRIKGIKTPSINNIYGNIKDWFIESTN